MTAPRALLFDVDGTLADTEAVHCEAFNQAFAELGLAWRWSPALYTRLLKISGGKERLAAYWSEVERGPVDLELVERVHAAKTLAYTKAVAGGRVPLRPGVLRLLHEARSRGVPMAIATTTTPANIDALLRGPLGPGWRTAFAAVGDASTAVRKKPDPLVYLQVLAALQKPPRGCLAFEDSGNGLRAARAAGVPTIVTPTTFTARDEFTGALAVLPDLGAFGLEELGALLPA